MKFKKILAAVMSVAMLGSMSMMTGCNSQKKYTVGICQLIEHPALDAATKGFMDVLKEKLGDDIEFDEQNANNDSATCATIVNNFVAAGVDLIFAEIVAELKREYLISLEAAIPYPGRMNTPDKAFQQLIKNCDVIRVHADHYYKGCYMNRNRYMVDSSTMVIAVSDGREYGGTVATMRYASVIGCAIKEIHL